MLVRMAFGKLKQIKRVSGAGNKTGLFLILFLIFDLWKHHQECQGHTPVWQCRALGASSTMNQCKFSCVNKKMLALQTSKVHKVKCKQLTASSPETVKRALLATCQGLEPTVLCMEVLSSTDKVLAFSGLNHVKFFLYKCYTHNLTYIYNNHTQRWQGWGVTILLCRVIPKDRPSFHFLQVYSLRTSFIHVIHVFHNGINMVTMTKMTSLKQSNNDKKLNLELPEGIYKCMVKDQFISLALTVVLKGFFLYVWEGALAKYGEVLCYYLLQL